MFSRRPWSIVCLAIALGSLSLPRPASAAPILNPVNGHYYDVVNTPVNWQTASTAASASTFLGMPGHLVSITTAQENQFLTNTFGGGVLHFHWTGGLQPAGSPEPGGGWVWSTGESFVFQNWAAPGEPNNFGGTEDRIIFDHGVIANGKSWNDLKGAAISAGYVVEYEPVPEPATVAVFLGLVSVTWVRARRKVAAR